MRVCPFCGGKLQLTVNIRKLQCIECGRIVKNYEMALSELKANIKALPSRQRLEVLRRLVMAEWRYDQ